MKKTTIVIGVIFLLGVFFSIYSCRKSQNTGIDLPETYVPDGLVQSAQNFQVMKTSGAASVLSLHTGKPAHVLQPTWKEAKVHSISNSFSEMIVPSPIVPLDPKSGQGVIRKFLFTISGDKVTGGTIIQMFGSADYMTAHQNDLFENYVAGKTPSDFTGVAITYNLNYKYITSDVFKNGVKQGGIAYMSRDNGQHMNTKGALGTAIKTLDNCYYYFSVDYGITTPDGVFGYQGTDYYYIYYDCDDETLNNEYGPGVPDTGQDPTDYIPGGGGGGGGGGAPSGGGSGMNVSAATTYIDAHAELKSTRSCGVYVRYALAAGGIDMYSSSWPAYACNYGSYLIEWGFTSMTSNINDGYYTPQAGDVAVFQGFTYMGSDHTAGHIEMYDGTQWVSDFVQHQFTPGSSYRATGDPYVIYRP